MPLSSTLPQLDGMLAVDWPLAAGVVVGVLTRIAGLLLTGGLRLFPGVPVQVQVGLLAVLGVAASPAALLATTQAETAVVVPIMPVLATELLIGCGLGLAVALLVSVAEMAGSLLAAVAGLNWADAFTPGGSGGPGVARLCGWLGLAAFVMAGGQQVAVRGLLNSFWRLPVGTAVTPAAVTPLFDRLVHLPSLCLGLAFAIAVPVLVAVITVHVTAAIYLRAVSLTPGPGLLQGVAAAVLLGGLIAGSHQWTGPVGRLIRTPLEDTFEAVGPVSGASPDLRAEGGSR